MPDAGRACWFGGAVGAEIETKKGRGCYRSRTVLGFSVGLICKRWYYYSGSSGLFYFLPTFNAMAGFTASSDEKDYLGML